MHESGGSRRSLLGTHQTAPTWTESGAAARDAASRAKLDRRARGRRAQPGGNNARDGRMEESARPAQTPCNAAPPPRLGASSSPVDLSPFLELRNRGPRADVRARMKAPRPRLILGDSLNVLRTLPASSVDAVVTDSPYEIGFLRATWDASGIAYSVAFWREVLRVLKPGAHLLAFGAARTYHRMACAIEDAGFEIRDSCMWVTPQGMPKSLDVSKAIDASGGNPHLTREIGATLRASRLARGLTIREADARFCGGSTNWTWFEGRPKGQRIPSAATFKRIAAAWPELKRYAAAVASADRKVIATRRDSGGRNVPIIRRDAGTFDVTAPATRLARRWQGWGTALKPAHEPIVLARKPLAGTVAANVSTYGTGALNIDANRDRRGHRQAAAALRPEPSQPRYIGRGLGGGAWENTYGRWPAKRAPRRARRRRARRANRRRSRSSTCQRRRAPSATLGCDGSSRSEARRRAHRTRAQVRACLKSRRSGASFAGARPELLTRR